MSQFDVFGSKFAQDIFLQKYSMDGQETWEQTCKRVVNAVCNQLVDGETKTKILNYMVDRKFIPGGRYLYSSGRSFHQVNNCFLFRAEDSREGWADAMYKATSALMTGGGIGFDYSALREEGALIKRTGGKSTGPISLLKMVNEAGRHIMQGGQRRSAIYGSLNWKHPDIFKFMNAKNHSPELRAMKEKDFNFELPLELTNISVNYDTNFYVAIENENHPDHLHAKAVWEHNCRQAFSTAEPGMSFNFLKDNETLRNAPVSGETYVMTKNGYKKVSDILNQSIELWTGIQWAKTKFTKTRSNDETVTVTLTGRKQITCSKDHPFILEDGSRVNAVDLKVGQKIKTSLGISKDGTNSPDAYLLGCIYGDGYFHKKYPRAELALCGKKEILLTKLETSEIKPLSQSRDKRGILRLYYGNNPIFSARSKDIFPVEVFTWNLESRIEFLSGLLDTDGNDFNGQARISSVHLDFLKNVVRLAESIGLTGLINKGSNGSYKGTPTWNVILKGESTKLKTVRLVLKDSKLSQFKVVSIENNINQDVYCCDVGVSEHSFQAEGVIISNCTEVTSEDDSDKCNLGTVWMNRCKNRKEFADVVKYATIFLLCGGIYSDVPNEKIKEVGLKNNRIGLGLGGMHEWLMLRGLKYEVGPELHKWLNVYEQESSAAAFIYAKQLGVSIPKGVRAIAPTGSIGILAETSTGLEPLFCKAYKRRYFKDGKWVHQFVVDGAVKRLIEKGVKIEDIQDSYDLTFKERVKFQADVQNYVDMAISSTCNMPSWGSESNNESTLKEYSDILLKYSKRMRGFTAYPDGCRSGQPLTRVDLAEALSQEGQVFEEKEMECLNGVCGI